MTSNVFLNFPIENRLCCIAQTEREVNGENEDGKKIKFISSLAYMNFHEETTRSKRCISVYIHITCIYGRIRKKTLVVDWGSKGTKPKGTSQKGPAKRDQDPKGTMAKRDQGTKGTMAKRDHGQKGPRDKRDQGTKGTKTQKGPWAF